MTSNSKSGIDVEEEKIEETVSGIRVGLESTSDAPVGGEKGRVYS